jgi:L-threonylcarbamoyladenylate synthase
LSDKTPLIIPAASSLHKAVEAIRNGGVVAFPTETFYGLGADPFNPAALERLFTLKGREAGKAISVIIKDRASLDALAAPVPLEAELLIKKFWPGPLTIIFSAAGIVPDLLTGGTGRIGVRVSSSPETQRFVEALSGPITATSANPSGKTPPSTAEEVIGYFDGRIDVVIDGGRLFAAVPSTVVDVTGPGIRVLREGAILSSEIISTG